MYWVGPEVIVYNVYFKENGFLRGHRRFIV